MLMEGMWSIIFWLYLSEALAPGCVSWCAALRYRPERRL